MQYFQAHRPSPGGLIAILGGSGFIGTRLGQILADEHVAFRIGDLQPSTNFPESWTQCDVRDGQSVKNLLRGASTVINLAAEHRDDVRPISLYGEVNVGGASRVCEAACAEGLNQIIFTSSVAVYGFQSKPVDEEGPFEPFNEYGRTKLQGEAVYRSWAEEDPSRSLVIVRPTVVFGEGNRGNVYNLLQQIASGKFLMVGSGRNIKSMAYVGNIAAFLRHTLRLGPGVHIFNYVDSPDMNTRDLVDYVRDCLGQSGRLHRMPKAIAMAGGYLFDATARLSGRRFPISAVRVRKFCESTQFRADRVTQIGFSPLFSLREGLARTVQFEFPVK